MFDYLREKWANYGFEFLVVVSILFLVAMGLYRYFKGQRGTWSKDAIIPRSGYNKSPPSYSIQKPNTPKRGDSSGERECRRVLESVFGVPFNKSRPHFLNNPVTGGSFNLELDCFNDDMKLAIEYNGIQHYEYNPFFHKNKEHFLNQKYRDDMKMRMCKDNGITLIVVPYTVSVDNIQPYLISKLRSKGYRV